MLFLPRSFRVVTGWLALTTLAPLVVGCGGSGNSARNGGGTAGGAGGPASGQGGGGSASEATTNVAIDDEIGSICATKADGRYRCWAPDGAPASGAPLPDADYVRVQLTPAGLMALTRDGALQAVGPPIPPDLPSVASFRAVNMWGAPGLCLQTTAGDFLYGAYDPSSASLPAGTAMRWHMAAGPFVDSSCAFEGLYGAVRPDGTAWDEGHPALPGDDWKQIALGVHILCGIRTSGNVICVPSSRVATDPPPSFPPGPYLQVVATYQVACALRADGAIVCSRFDGAAVSAPAGAYVRLEAGRDLLCAVRSDGTSACFRQSGDSASIFEDYTLTAFAPLSPAIDDGW